MSATDLAFGIVLGVVALFVVVLPLAADALLFVVRLLAWCFATRRCWKRCLGERCVRKDGHFGVCATKTMQRDDGSLYRVRFTADDLSGCRASWGETVARRRTP